MTATLHDRLARLSTNATSVSARAHCVMVRHQLSFPEGSSQFKIGVASLRQLEKADTLPPKLKMAAIDFHFNQSVGSILAIGDAGVAALPLLPDLRNEYLRTANSRVKKALIAAITSIDPATTAELLRNADTATVNDSIAAACGFAKRRNRSSTIRALENCDNFVVRDTVRWWKAEAAKRSNVSSHISVPLAVSAVRGNLARLTYRAACSPLIRKHVVDRYHKLFLRVKIALFEFNGLIIPAELKSL